MAVLLVCAWELSVTRYPLMLFYDSVFSSLRLVVKPGCKHTWQHAPLSTRT